MKKNIISIIIGIISLIGLVGAIIYLKNESLKVLIVTWISFLRN